MRQECGYTRLSSIFLLAVIGAGIYAAHTAWPVATQYLNMKRAVTVLANRALETTGDPQRLVDHFVDTAQNANLPVSRENVTVERVSDDVVRVRLSVAIPYRLPFDKEQRYYRRTIDTEVKRFKSF